MIDENELRELVRYAQHHVPRDAPDVIEFLTRALVALGSEFANEGDSRLRMYKGPTP